MKTTYPAYVKAQEMDKFFNHGAVEYRNYHGYKVGEDGSVYTPYGRRSNGSFNNAGYLQVSITIDGERTYPTVHKLVTLLFLGERPQGMVTNHKDGNKANNALSNLEYCTPQENSDHAIALGLVPPSTVRGSNHKRSKLTEADVQDIRGRLATETPSSIARAYHVSPDLIYRIRDGKAWQWLKTA